MVSLSIVGFPILVAILDAILKFAIEKVHRRKNTEIHTSMQFKQFALSKLRISFAKKHTFFFSFAAILDAMLY